MSLNNLQRQAEASPPKTKKKFTIMPFTSFMSYFVTIKQRAFLLNEITELLLIFRTSKQACTKSIPETFKKTKGGYY